MQKGVELEEPFKVQGGVGGQAVVVVAKEVLARSVQGVR